MDIRLPTRIALAVALTVSTLGVAGCAGLRCPRIDPTGERFLIWPKDQPQIAPPPGSSSLQAPPVTTDPYFPSAAVPGSAVIGAPPATSAGAANVPIAAPGAIAVDKLTISPERVLAPIGSEVVLKSGICTADGYLLADERIEWMLGRNGVGQFVELGGKGWFHPPLLPWNQGKKIDNYYAVGYAANGPLCITRGTADPSDDVEIRRGEAWVSVTSPVEGVSHLTSHTPRVESWTQRSAQATIYWVDVQWTFPPSSINGSGQPEQLTTIVTRQSDGMPLEGYIVRYEVDPGATGIAGSGQVSEIRTGPDGRASVEVTPTGLGAARSRIDYQLLRPAGYGNGQMPELVVGSGTTIIHWDANAVPYLPPSNGGGVTPAPDLWQPPAEEQPESMPQTRPVLEVEVTRLPGSKLEVGGYADFDIVIFNRGDAPANSVNLEISYPEGLETSLDEDRTYRIETSAPGTIPPGGTWRTGNPVRFNINRAGQHCITISANSLETNSTPQRSCFTAVQPQQQPQGRLDVSKDGPTQAVRGGTAAFRIIVENTGDAALANILVEDEYPVGFLVPTQQIPQGATDLGGGLVTWTIPQLAPGGHATYEIVCECVQANSNAVSYVTVRADAPSGRIESADDHELFIAEPQPGGGQFPGDQGGGADSRPFTNAASPTAIYVDFRRSGTTGETRVGTSDAIDIRVLNRNPRGGGADSQVSVSLELPQARGQGQPLPIAPDLDRTETPAFATPTLKGNVIRFATINGLRGQDELVFSVPVTFNRADIHRVVARVSSTNLTQSGRDVETAVAEIEVMNQ